MLIFAKNFFFTGIPPYPEMKHFNEYSGFNLVANQQVESSNSGSVKASSSAVCPLERVAPLLSFRGTALGQRYAGIHHVLARTIKDIFCRSRP